MWRKIGAIGSFVETSNFYGFQVHERQAWSSGQLPYTIEVRYRVSVRCGWTASANLRSKRSGEKGSARSDVLWHRCLPMRAGKMPHRQRGAQQPASQEQP